jgi:hypothetical protein
MEWPGISGGFGGSGAATGAGCGAGACWWAQAVAARAIKATRSVIFDMFPS